MKNILLLLFIPFSFNCFSQEHLINGTVYSGDKHKPVSKVKVVLHMPDSKTMEFTTDSTGTYFFKSSGPGKFFITAEKCVKRNCGLGECYLDKKFVIDPNALASDNSIFCDLTLMPVRIEYNLPAISFKKNSIVPDSCSSCYEKVIDSACYCAAQFLINNPNLLISIDGYAEANEKDPEILSQERALVVKKILLKYFKDEKRISVKGFGTKTVPSHQQNNRVVAFSGTKT